MKTQDLKQLFDTSKRAGETGAARINREARFCLWAGQSEDGRKWQKHLGYEPVPFDGASDSRPALVDLYVQEDRDFLCALADEASFGALPMEPMDAERANQASLVLRWMVEQTPNVADERELAADYFLGQGKAVVGIFWGRKVRRERRTVRLEDIVLAATQSQPPHPGLLPQGGEGMGSMGGMASLPEMILNEGMEEAAAAALMTALDQGPETPAEAKKLVRALRTKGVGEWQRETIVHEGPEIQTYSWGDDFLAPPGTTDLQKAPALFVRQFFTGEQLEIEGRDYGWSEEFIAAALAKVKPGSNSGLLAATLVTPGARNDRSLEAGWLEVVTAVHWDTSKGAAELRVTTFAPDLMTDTLTAREDARPTGIALDEPLGYARQEMPFVCLARERVSRRLEDSRGYGQIAHTWQWQLKVSWDLRTDRNYLTTVPPLFHPPGRTPKKWGPGVRVPRVHQGDYQYAEGPAYNVDERALEENVLRFCDRYFGRAEVAGESQAMVRRRALGARWLRGWREVYRWVFQLCQQFLDREIFVRVAGTPTAAMLGVKPEDIRGAFDVTVYFDPDRLDLETMKEKIGFLTTIAQFAGGENLDRAAMIRVALNYVDPRLAEILLRPAEEARQSELDDEDATFAKLSSYVDVDVREGQAFGMRLNRLQQLAQNPAVQARLGQDKEFAALVEKRAKQLRQQIINAPGGPNAQIGKLGG